MGPNRACSHIQYVGILVMVRVCITAVNTFRTSSLLAPEGRLVMRRIGAHANRFSKHGII